MKKIKLLTPLAIGLATVGSLTPLFALSSCGRNKNLMKEYTPTIDPLDRQSFKDVDTCVKKYLEIVNGNKKVFVQDLIYTISRGMPQYISYISEYCEIADHNFGINVDQKSIKVDINKKTITFDATFDVMFDYTGTQPHEMEWYDMHAYRWDTKTKVRFVFDFDTNGFDNIDIDSNHGNGQRRRMTTLAGATQFGVSEINSTVQLLSEKGHYIDLNKKRHDINTTSPEAKQYHFMLPDRGYWKTQDSTEQKYNELYSEVYDLWFNHPSLQVIVLLFKYYMPNNTYQCVNVPNVFDFGSYHMKNATLDDTFSYKKIGSDTTVTLFGFNSSLDCINNIKNLKKESKTVYDPDKKEFKIPGNFKVDGVETRAEAIAPNAFNSRISNYSNFGIPEEVKSVIVTQNYKSIGMKAFAQNPYIESITIERTENADFPIALSNSFYLLNNLKVIDLSSFDNDKISQSTTKFNGAFADVHLGNPVPQDLKEGTIYLPSSWTDHENDWKTFLNNAGLDIYDPSSSTPGWELKTK